MVAIYNKSNTTLHTKCPGSPTIATPSIILCSVGLVPLAPHARRQDAEWVSLGVEDPLIKADEVGIVIEKQVEILEGFGKEKAM